MKLKLLITIFLTTSFIYSYSQQEKTKKASNTYYVELLNFSDKLIECINKNLFGKNNNLKDITFKSYNLIKADEKNLKDETNKIKVKLIKERSIPTITVERFVRDVDTWRRVLNMGECKLQNTQRNNIEKMGKEIASYILISVLK